MKEIKQFKFSMKAIKEDGSFSGHAAVFGNEDLGGDVIEPGAFKKTLSERTDFPILFNHNYYDMPIGVNVNASEDSKGLYVEGQLAMDVQKAKEVRSLMQMGALKGLSIGYDPVVVDYSKIDEGIRILREIKLWEYSVVTFPMNPEAQISQVKKNSQKTFLATIEQALWFANQDLGDLNDEQKGKVAKLIEKLSALGAAKALRAAEQTNDAPVIHASLTSLSDLLAGKAKQ